MTFKVGDRVRIKRELGLGYYGSQLSYNKSYVVQGLNGIYINLIRDDGFKDFLFFAKNFEKVEKINIERGDIVKVELEATVTEVFDEFQTVRVYLEGQNFNISEENVAKIVKKYKPPLKVGDIVAYNGYGNKYKILGLDVVNDTVWAEKLDIHHLQVVLYRVSKDYKKVEE